MEAHSSGFRAVFVKQLELMNHVDREKGKKMVQMYFEHIRAAFLTILRQDPEISSSVWGDVFTPKKFVDFLISNILTALSKVASGKQYLAEVVRRLLYT